MESYCQTTLLFTRQDGKRILRLASGSNRIQGEIFSSNRVLGGFYAWPLKFKQIIKCVFCRSCSFPERKDTPRISEFHVSLNVWCLLTKSLTTFRMPHPHSRMSHKLRTQTQTLSTHVERGNIWASYKSYLLQNWLSVRFQL